MTEEFCPVCKKTFEVNGYGSGHGCIGGSGGNGGKKTSYREEMSRQNNQSQLLTELIEEVEKQKIGNFKEWYKATKEYGGTKEEWNKLNNRGHDRVIDDVIQLLKSKL